MKRMLTLLTICLVMCSSSMLAQTFEVESKTDGVIYVLKDDFQIEGKLSIINNGALPVDLKVSMFPTLAAGHTAYFCWDECYAPTSMPLTSKQSSAVAGNSVDDFTFSYYLNPNGIEGYSEVTFTFFDVLDPENKVVVVLKFDAVVTDVEDNLASMVTMNAFPSPATAAAYISYEMPESAVSQEAVVEISNVFGNTMETYAIRNSKGVLPIDVSNMAPGVYFYSILVDGVRIQSRKLVVKK